MHNLDSLVDPPFLSHRSWLPVPTDADSFIKELIIAELNSAIDSQDEINKCINSESIMSYLEYAKPDHLYKVKLPSGSERELKKDDIEFILNEGLGKDENRNKINKGKNGKQKIGKSAFKDFTKTYCFNNEDHQKLDQKFSALTSLNNYLKPINHSLPLHIGTIVKINLTSQFLLCIQPKCDSVRIKDDRNFLFLTLDHVEENFDIVIVDDNNVVIKLSISKNVHDIVTYKFSANENGAVRSINIGGVPSFRSANTPLLNWIAQLKESLSLSIVQKYSSDLSRVGFDQYEWLRLHSK